MNRVSKKQDESASGQGNTSVCRNCCFENECTRDWQPNSYDEWRILPKTPQMREMMVFDQFANPPDHWMKAAEQRRIEYFTNLEDMMEPPTKKGKKKDKETKGEENAKQESNGVINLRTTRAPPTTRQTIPRTTRRTTPRTTRRPQTTKQVTKVKTTTRPARFGMGNTLGSQNRPVGAQKQGQPMNMQRMMQMRQARMKAAAAAAKKQQPNTTQKPKIVKTTPKTQKSTKISDDDFLNLLNILGKDSSKKEKQPSNNQMRFSLNVNENGEVNQMYGKDAEKKNSNVAGRLGKPVNQQAKHPANQVINRNQFSQKAQPVQEKNGFGPASTTAKSPTTATKKGPWSHLPPWKQRQLKAARAKQMAARQAAMAAKASGNAPQKPVIKATPKPVVQKKPVMKKPTQPIRPQGMRPGPGIKKPNQKAPIRRTPHIRAPVPSGDKKMKMKKPSAARPQMLKFSQWAEPTDAKLEEGEIIEVVSDVSDDQFAQMISQMDTKNGDIDFDSLIHEIENEQEELFHSGPDPRYRMTDEEFDDFVSQLS